ncbi:divisome protein SepX/GlpR [Williamsia soli]|uniref:divisome protein SepX/GlpR n=1 Tax=Williamsia soli TaxID=364929 RepID=UPI001A9E9FE3|nr:gephyrin-like molybdotransferase receptor GlpR [Williamsia soli]
MPNSLLWVCLVAIWLFVLVPMVVKSRPTVRKTSDTALSTRVLHRGGRTMARTKRRIASGRHPHDADWEPPVREYRKAATATAVKDVDETEDLDESDSENIVEKAPREKASQTESAPVLKKVAVEAESQDDEDSGDVESVEAVETEAVDAEAAEAEGVESDVVEGESDGDDAVAEVEEDQDVIDDDAVDEVDDEHDADAEYDDDYDDEAEYDDDLDDEDTDEPVAETESERRARRGGFDPEADRERSDKRYRFRQRVMAVFALLLVAALGAGVLLGTAGWVLAGLVGVALLGYMTFLRRAVRNEQRIRQQRMRRLARAKRLEEERREHPEEDPRAEIPRRLRRPGAIVLEIDDEDPVFDHLPRYERVERVEREPSYRRVVGQ